MNLPSLKVSFYYIELSKYFAEEKFSRMKSIFYPGLWIEDTFYLITSHEKTI